MNGFIKDARELLRALSAVDEDHFIIIEHACVEIYHRADFLPTPMPTGCCVLDIPDDKVASGLLEEDI